MKLRNRAALAVVPLLAAGAAFADPPTDIPSLASGVAFTGVGAGILAIAAAVAAVLVIKKGARWVLSMIGR